MQLETWFPPLFHGFSQQVFFFRFVENRHHIWSGSTFKQHPLRSSWKPLEVDHIRWQQKHLQDSPTHRGAIVHRHCDKFTNFGNFLASLAHTFLVKLVATFIGPEIAILFAIFTNKWQEWFFFVNKDGCWYCFRVFSKMQVFDSCCKKRAKLTNQTTKLPKLDNCFIFECCNLAAMYVDASVEAPQWCQCGSCVTFRSEVFRNMARMDTSDQPLWGPLSRIFVASVCWVQSHGSNEKMRNFIGNKCIDLPDQLDCFKDCMRPQTKTSQVFLVAVGRFMLQLWERIMVLQTLQCGYLYVSKGGYISIYII